MGVRVAVEDTVGRRIQISAAPVPCLIYFPGMKKKREVRRDLTWGHDLIVAVAGVGCCRIICFDCALVKESRRGRKQLFFF